MMSAQGAMWIELKANLCVKGKLLSIKSLVLIKELISGRILKWYKCRIESNIRIEQNIYFVDADLIPTRGQLSVALGILVLVHLFEKRLYWPGTDMSYWMAQHSSTTDSINMQWHQLQGSYQQTTDNNTDIFCNNSHEMPLRGVECPESSCVCSALNPFTNWPRI